MTPIEKREHFAKIRREVVLHRMATADSLDDQLFWAIILWSWTGPQPSAGGAVVLKDKKGYIRADNHEQPIPAKLKDLRELMGWPEGMKGEVTRIIQRLIEKNSITFDKKTGILYAVDEPSLPEIPKAVAGTRNWCVGRAVVGTRNLPTDPVAREKAVLWLEATSTAWKNDLKTLRTRYRDMLVQAAPELGILYVLKEKKSREEEESSSAVSTTTGNGKAEEEDQPPYEQFKAEYPADHFDEPKTKPSFERKTKTQQLQVLERLRVFKDSPRWKDENGRWIPLSSNWLPTCDADPPPVIPRKSAAPAKKGFTESVMEEAKRRYEKYGRV